MAPTLSVLWLASAASAAFVHNLNYFSPSLHHPSLGVSIGKVAKRTFDAPSWDPSKLNFTHGVASGDPYETSVILWTRIAPTSDNDRSNVTVKGTVPLYDHDNEYYVSKSQAPICVEWTISADESGTKDPLSCGQVYTSSDVDYTVKVEATKLSGFSTYCELHPSDWVD